MKSGASATEHTSASVDRDVPPTALITHCYACIGRPPSPGRSILARRLRKPVDPRARRIMNSSAGAGGPRLAGEKAQPRASELYLPRLFPCFALSPPAPMTKVFFFRLLPVHFFSSAAPAFPLGGGRKKVDAPEIYGFGRSQSRATRLTSEARRRKAHDDRILFWAGRSAVLGRPHET